MSNRTGIERNDGGWKLKQGIIININISLWFQHWNYCSSSCNRTCWTNEVTMILFPNPNLLRAWCRSRPDWSEGHPHTLSLTALYSYRGWTSDAAQAAMEWKLHFYLWIWINHADDRTEKVKWMATATWWRDKSAERHVMKHDFFFMSIINSYSCFNHHMPLWSLLYQRQYESPFSSLF